ncbi:Fic family protein [Algoriphagus boritolerans]
MEDAAATILYLSIENHGFVDGNKRIAIASIKKPSYKNE